MIRRQHPRHSIAESMANNGCWPTATCRSNHRGYIVGHIMKRYSCKRAFAATDASRIWQDGLKSCFCNPSAEIVEILYPACQRRNENDWLPLSTHGDMDDGISRSH